MTITGYIEPGRLEKKVYKKLKEIGVSKYDYPINPYDLIKSEGIILQEIPLDDINIRGMIVNGENASGILINSNRSYVSRRFIAMHELCHYWFHPRQTKTICFENYSQARHGIEWQANNAAAFALMPTPIIDDLCRIYGYNVDIISDELKVSRDSFIYRTGDAYKGYTEYETLRYTRMIEEDKRFIAIENEWLYGGL